MTVLSPGCGPHAQVVGSAARSPATNGTIYGLAAFTLHNPSSSPSTVRFCLGHPFRKGDIPRASGIEVLRSDGRKIRYSIGEINSWGDGSIRKATIWLADGNIPAGGSRTYVIRKTTTRSSSATALAYWSWLAANTDLKVEATGRRGFTTGPMPDAVASLRQHIVTPTRRRVLHDSSLVCRLYAWGMFGADKHLKANHYVDLWLGQDGVTPQALEYVAVVAQDWFVANPFGDGAQTRERQDYSAAVKDGSVVLGTYADVQHHYGAGWATVSTSALDGGELARRARPLWRTLNGYAGSQPTLWVEIDARYWIASGLVPPHRLTGGGPWAPLTSLSNSSGLGANNCADYVPLSNLGHRGDVDGTGPYQGRGVITNFDAIRLIAQSRDNDAYARVAGHAGMHPCLYRSRDHRSDGSDVTNRPIPLKKRLRSVTTSPSYPGLPASVWAFTYPNGRYNGYKDIVYEPITGGSVKGWPPPGGSTKTTHSVSYSYFTALVTGQRYLTDTCLDLAWSAVQRGGGGEYLLYNAAQNPDRLPGVPSWTYAPMTEATSELRSIPFAMSILAHAHALVPDGEPEQAPLSDMIDVYARYVQDNLDAGMPPDQKAAGNLYAYYSGTPGLYYPNYPTWQHWLHIVCAAAAHKITERAEFKSWVDTAANLVARVWGSNVPYQSNFQIHLGPPRYAQLGPDNEHLGGQLFQTANVAVTFAADGTIIVPKANWAVYRSRILVGDEVIFTRVVQAGTNSYLVDLPAELIEGARYRVVTVSQGLCDGASDATFKVAAQGSAQPVTFTAAGGPVGFAIRQQHLIGKSPQGIDAGDGRMRTLAADDYWEPMAWAALESASWIGSPNVTQPMRDAAASFLENWSPTSFAGWWMGENH